MFRQICSISLVSAAGLAALTTAPAIAEEATPMIQDTRQVSFTYTLTSTSDGEVIESNAGQEPFVYVQGGGQVLPALEAELAGMRAGDQKTVNLDAVDAYGEVNEEAFQEAPLNEIPEDARVVGTVLRSDGYAGPIRVTEIKEDVVILDFNHPLAGKDLTFDITIVSVTEGPPAAPAN
jgi:FKBP-type peptidyl-prolyl cis-trans isomerase 2